jgi:uncharacterized protein
VRITETKPRRAYHSLAVAKFHSKFDLNDVPLFPLPGVVLMPHGVLPLHIFEQRYRDMMEDVLARDDAPLMAMAQVVPGGQQTYQGMPADAPRIYQAVCVGIVGRYDRLPDGRFNLILSGTLRANIVREIAGKSYRRAVLERIADQPASTQQSEHIRLRLKSLCTHSTLVKHASACGEILNLIETEKMPIDVLMDVVMNSICEDCNVKQRVLGEADVYKRMSLGIEALETAFPTVRTPMRHEPPSLN